LGGFLWELLTTILYGALALDLFYIYYQKRPSTKSISEGIFITVAGFFISNLSAWILIIFLNESKRHEYLYGCLVIVIVISSAYIICFPHHQREEKNEKLGAGCF